KMFADKQNGNYNPGHDNPGHDNPGNHAPGHDNPGHHDPGHDNPGNHDPGGDDPGHHDPHQPGGWPNGFLFGGNAHNTLDSIQSSIGGRANLEMFPVRTNDGAGLRHVQEDLSRGVTPEVSLNGEPFAHGSRGIAAGEYDAELTRMARAM